MTVIVNGSDKNNKRIRKEFNVNCVHEKDICDIAFKNGFYYVKSYRYNGLTIKIY